MEIRAVATKMLTESLSDDHTVSFKRIATLGGLQPVFGGYGAEATKGVEALDYGGN